MEYFRAQDPSPNSLLAVLFSPHASRSRPLVDENACAALGFSARAALLAEGLGSNLNLLLTKACLIFLGL
jgi:hypothetical protein